MTKPIQLHVGYVGVTREGKRVEIVRANNNMWTVQYPWTDDNLSWCDNGEYHADSQMHNFDIVGPWVEPVKSLIQLHVGYVGVTREGKRVAITAHYGGALWTDDLKSWLDDGRYERHGSGHVRDIVGPWVEPKAPINYNDGKWHQWNGSECPVHPNSTVEMISTQSVMPNHRAANSFTWDHELDPILAFRVTKEFVAPKEPRELWVSLNDYQAHETEADAQEHDKALGCNHGYFHVKEVM
jgi:hypothetical protein